MPSVHWQRGSFSAALPWDSDPDIPCWGAVGGPMESAMRCWPQGATGASRRLDAQKPRTVSLQGSSTDEVYSSASLQGRNAPAFLVGPQRVDLELKGIE